MHEYNLCYARIYVSEPYVAFRTFGLKGNVRIAIIAFIDLQIDDWQR